MTSYDQLHMSSAPKSLLDVANAENSSVPAVDNGPVKKAVPTSLLDVANESKSAAKDTEKPTLLSVAKEEHVSKPTLVEVAKAPKTLAEVAPVSLVQAVAASQKSSLTDVATELRQDKTSSFQKKASITLTEVAATVEKERDQIIHNAIEDAAKDVKHEQKEQSEKVGKVLVQAAKEVAKEAQAVTRKDVVAKLTKVATEVQSIVQNKVNEKVPENQENEENEEDEYSDFEETDKDKKTKPKEKEDDDNQSECIEEVEKAVRTSSTESKSFMQAIYRGNLRRVKELLQNDTDVNVADQHGWNGLHWAASQGHSDILEHLIDNGANVQVVDPIHLWSPLQLAVIRGHVSCAKLLLRKGAIATREDIYGDTAVSCAASHRGSIKTQLNALFQKYNGR